VLSLRQIPTDHAPSADRPPSAAPIARAALAGGADSSEPARSLYIHVPFCAHKCHYCDFYSIVDRRDRQAAFTDRLVRELAALDPLARGLPLRTIFVGGGTPSLLEPALWERLLRAAFGLMGDQPETRR